MKSVKRKCSRCGDPGLHLKKRPAIRTVAGHSFKASVPAQVCDSCGAVYFNGTALGDFDLDGSALREFLFHDSLHRLRDLHDRLVLEAAIEGAAVDLRGG